jgi:hypothetical protein
MDQGLKLLNQFEAIPMQGFGFPKKFQGDEFYRLSI